MTLSEECSGFYNHQWIGFRWSARGKYCGEGVLELHRYRGCVRLFI